MENNKNYKLVFFKTTPKNKNKVRRKEIKYLIIIKGLWTSLVLQNMQTKPELIFLFVRVVKFIVLYHSWRVWGNVYPCALMVDYHFRQTLKGKKKLSISILHPEPSLSQRGICKCVTKKERKRELNNIRVLAQITLLQFIWII